MPVATLVQDGRLRRAGGDAAPPRAGAGGGSGDVLPEARDGGVGTALMREVRAAARERAATTLSVGLVHANEGARRFYEREGFRPFYLQMLADA